ncbi:MAG: tetratricopeptide repeat protein [Steroidobacteraceae bacterium]
MAMNMVGRCYEYGLGTPLHYARAAHWYHRAATFDCDWAIYNYAHLLASGRGVKQDRAAAFVWFKLAASRGHARAMAFLGQYYENGWETPADRAAAVRWYQRSAEAGDYRGRCNYAFALARDGRTDEALAWLRLTATTAPPHSLQQLAEALRRSPHEALRAFADTLPVSAAPPPTPEVP